LTNQKFSVAKKSHKISLSEKIFIQKCWDWKPHFGGKIKILSTHRSYLLCWKFAVSVGRLQLPASPTFWLTTMLQWPQNIANIKAAMLGIRTKALRS